MSNVWFTSDLHIGHALVARQRFAQHAHEIPVDDDDQAVMWHDTALAVDWDRLVHPKDSVWVLGDISDGGAAAEARSLWWMSERPGIKHLVAGNHDRCHPMHRDAHKHLRTFLGVFESVQAFARRRVAGRSVLLSHFPYHMDHTPVARYRQYRLRDYGEPLLHGHTHSAERVKGNQIHIGLDAWNQRLVHIDEIAALVKQLPNSGRPQL